MVKQQALTLLTPVQPGCAGQLRDELDLIQQELKKGVQQPFEQLGTIHYARWVLVDPPAEGKGRVHLAFSSDYDVTAADHIRELCTRAGSFVDRIYRYCEGYPQPGQITDDVRCRYLSQWQQKSIGFFVGAPGRSLAQIRREARLYQSIRAWLNEKPLQGLSPSQLHHALRQRVLSDPAFAWVQEPVRLPAISYAGLGLMGLVLLLVAPFVIVWLLVVQIFYERKDIPLGLTPSQVDATHIRRLEQYEDWTYQNQFTQVLTMKAGRARLLTLQGFMLFARHLIKNMFVDGKLMGIPTIHFARWVMMDGNRRMLFFSNFDGSWQQYLGDFIDKSGWGLTAIWSNSIGFPRTRFSFFDGAYDAQHFLAWSRYYQVPTQVWYSAYPDLSIKNIINNTHVRSELLRDLNDRQAMRFLQRL